MVDVTVDGPERPTISVVIPCHNYGRFLDDALASLDAQDRSPDEIVICDDGSTDDSWDLIQRAVQGRDDVVAYRHDRAMGIVGTFNELVRRSHGEFVLLLSADDELGPGFLGRMESDLVERNLAFGYSDVVCFGSENWRFVVPELAIDRLARFNYITASSLFRRSLFDDVGGYRPAFSTLGFEDYDFWLTAIERGHVGAKVHGCELRWRRHEGGSRNTVGRWARVLLRLKLVRHHPRFFVHKRSVFALLGRYDPVRGLESPP